MLPPKMPEWPVDVAYHELPAWMRRTRRVVDWPLALVGVLIAAVIAPLVMQPGLPWSAGLRSEVARALEISESIQAGILYPRWAGDFNLGYGSPMWNYLPPLPHYFAGLHRVLAQTSAEYSVKFTLIAALILLAGALFGFVRRRWGTYAGLLAAALGLFSPQIALVKPLLEADLGALWAGGFCLTALWALDRLLASGRGGDLLLAAGACAGVWLAHQPLNLIFGALILAWLLLRLAEARFSVESGLGLLAVALGFLASALYWLPAWSERAAVEWRPAVEALPARGSPGLLSVFGWLPPLDRAAINPAPVPTLGVALWAAAAIAILLSLARLVQPRGHRAASPELTGQRRKDREALLFGLAGALLVAAALPPLGDRWASAIEWPPFGPSDLIFPAALCCALAGASWGYRCEYDRSPRRGAASMIALAVAIAAAGLPALQTPARPSAEPPMTLAGLVQSEALGVPLAAREPGWLLPGGVAGLPAVDLSLVASYQTGAVDPVARGNLPAATLVDVIERTPAGERILIRSAEAAEITLRTFMVAGRRVTLDDQPLAARATEPEGFIALQVPAGRHEVQLSHRPTSARIAGWALSGAACLALLGVAIRLEHRAPTHPPAREPASEAALHRRGTSRAGEWAVMLGMLIVLAGGAVVARTRPGWFSIHSPRGEVLQADTALPRAFQGGIDLLAFDLRQPADRRGPLEVTLYWRGWRPDLPHYQVELTLVRAGDPSTAFPLAQRRHPGLLPSSEWPRWSLLDHYVRDPYALAIPPDAPAGDYQLAVQVGRCSQMQPEPCAAITPVFVHDGRGTSLGQSVLLPDVITLTGQ